MISKQLEYLSSALAVATLSFVVSSVHARSDPEASDYFVAPTVSYGQKLIYEIDFPVAPISSIGPADMFFVNAGGSLRGVQGVTTELYVGDQLIGSTTRDQNAPLGLFAKASSPFEAFGFLVPTVVDSELLEALFNGSKIGTVVITPSFSDPSGFATYGGTFFHAVTANGVTNDHDQRWEDIFPPPRLISAFVVDVPEPGIAILLGLGLGLIGLTARIRKRARYLCSTERRSAHSRS